MFRITLPTTPPFPPPWPRAEPTPTHPTLSVTRPSRFVRSTVPSIDGFFLSPLLLMPSVLHRRLQAGAIPQSGRNQAPADAVPACCE